MNQEIKQIIMSRYNQLLQKGGDCIKTIVFFCLTRQNKAIIGFTLYSRYTD